MKIPHSLPLVGKVLVVVCLCGMLGLASAFAQSSNQWSLSGNLPFDFQVDKTVFPAGSYKFVLIRQPGGFPKLTINGSSGNSGSYHVSTKIGGGFNFGDSRLIFDEADSKHYLSEVWTTGQDGYLLQTPVKEHTHRTFLITGSNASAQLPGNKVYEQTCQRCHGANGQGNSDADKFFKVAIPKLASASVQAKSDAELREVIAQGKGNMSPVRIGQSSVQHLLPPESVDAVISFLRTLK